MKMRKAIKKIVALGTGTAMVGATLVGAMAAADLANYPAPFIQNGQFNAMIVVGDTAAPADIVGAIDVAASLQYHMRQTSTVAVDGATSTSVTGGAKVETSAQKVWYLYSLAGVKSTFDDTDLDFLADGEVTDENGNDYTYKQYIRLPYANVAWGEPDSDLDMGIAYLDFTSSGRNYTAELQFPTAPRIGNLTNKKMTMFGKEFTFSGRASELTNESIVMYAAGLDQTFTAGDTTTVTVGNEDIDIEVIGVNTQTTTPTATIKVNGESKSVQSNDNPSIGGVKIYVKDIFAYTAPVTSGAVRLFIGSDKYTFEHGQTVTKGSGSDDIEGVSTVITTGGVGKVSKIKWEVDPYSVEKGDDTWTFLAAGDEMVDPLFGSFKMAFTGITPDFDSELRTHLKIWPSSDDKVNIMFTSRTEGAYDLNIMNASQGWSSGNVSTTLQVDDKALRTRSTTGAADEEYILIGQDGYTRIVQVKKIDEGENKIKLKDLGESTTNEYTYQVSDGAFHTGTMTTSEGDYTFYVDETANVVNFSQATTNIYTKYGLKIELANANTTDVPLIHLPVIEETDYNDVSTTDEGNINATDGGTANMFNITLDYDTANTKVTLDKTETLPGSFQQTESGDNYEFVTPYGTYMKYNSDSDTLEMFYYKDITSYDIFFAPVEGTVVSSGGADGVETTTIQKIAVGAAKLASEVTNVAAQNLVSVGGPCVNSVSAALMGNPANCAEGFTPGVAKVKLFEQTNGNVAMMIAGYSADDTKRATRVVSDFDQYEGFTGMEIEVSGTTMNDITVSAPVVTTTTTTVAQEEATLPGEVADTGLTE